MKEILQNLCDIPAVSGDERYARPLLEQLRQVADGVRQLSGGSIVAYNAGCPSGSDRSDGQEYR